MKIEREIACSHLPVRSDQWCEAKQFCRFASPKMSQKAYTIKATGSSKIAAALAKLCAAGSLGEPLVRTGCSQAAFCLFLAKLACAHHDAGKTPEQIAEVFDLVGGGNASQAKQALAACALKWEGEKDEQSVGKFWEEMGGAKAPLNLAILDL